MVSVDESDFHVDQHDANGDRLASIFLHLDMAYHNLFQLVLADADWEHDESYHDRRWDDSASCAAACSNASSLSSMVRSSNDSSDPAEGQAKPYLS